MTFCCPRETQTISGVRCSGSARVDLANDLYDGMTAVYPLDELADGTPEEYIDHSRNQLHGTGGDGEDIDLVPIRDMGVFCLYSQYFLERQFITLPQDNLQMDQGFSVSLWGKIESFYQQRVFFSRGFESEDGNEWVFTFGHSFLNQVVASVRTIASNGTEKAYNSFGTTWLQRDQFYHFAVSFEPGVGIKLYVNGVLNGSLAVPDFMTIPATNGNYLSRWNNGGFMTGNLQEVRIHPCVRSANWFLAEFENLCDFSFYETAGLENATY